MKPVFSICMTCFNMEDTVHRSLLSILCQIDNTFEVIFLDDGSTDNSYNIAYELSKQFENLHVHRLPRDKKRKLGFTRNESIKLANGKFVLLHLDCDDVVGPHLISFSQVFLRIFNCIGHDVLVSGKHINIARKEFLLAHGPYINIYRGEDRHLWSRMARINRWVPLEHQDFISRLPKRNKRYKLLKNFKDTLDHMTTDFRTGVSFFKYVNYELCKINTYSFQYFVFRLSMLFPAKILSLFKPEISRKGLMDSVEKFAEYRDTNTLKYAQIMKRNKCNEDLGFLADEKEIAIFK